MYFRPASIPLIFSLFCRPLTKNNLMSFFFSYFDGNERIPE